MLRASFARKLAEGTELTKGAAEIFLSRLSFVIEREISAGRKVYVTGLGGLFLSKRQGRTIVDPNDRSRSIVVPSMSVIRFSPSKKIKRAARKNV